MATGFRLVSYTTDAGTVGRIRMSSQARDYVGQGSTATIVTDPAVFAFAANPGSKRKKQLNARGIVITREVGTAPNIIVRRTFIAITTVTALNLITVGTAIPAYGGQAYVVASKVSEA